MTEEWLLSIPPTQVSAAIGGPSGTIVTFGIRRPSQDNEVLRVSLRRRPVNTIDAADWVKVKRRRHGDFRWKRWKWRRLELAGSHLKVLEGPKVLDGDFTPKYYVDMDEVRIIGREMARKKTGKEWSFGFVDSHAAYFLNCKSQERFEHWYKVLSEITVNMLQMNIKAASDMPPGTCLQSRQLELPR